MRIDLPSEEFAKWWCSQARYQPEGYEATERLVREAFEAGQAASASALSEERNALAHSERMGVRQADLISQLERDLAEEKQEHRATLALAADVREHAELITGVAESICDVIETPESFSNVALENLAKRMRRAINDQTGSAKAAGAPGAESTAAPTHECHETYNDSATLERAIAYCQGQAMHWPDCPEDRAYDKGVAACVRMLEDMMPTHSRHQSCNNIPARSEHHEDQASRRDVEPGVGVAVRPTSADSNSRPDHGNGEHTGTNRGTTAEAGGSAGCPLWKFCSLEQHAKRTAEVVELLREETYHDDLYIEAAIDRLSNLQGELEHQALRHQVWQWHPATELPPRGKHACSDTVLATDGKRIGTRYFDWQAQEWRGDSRSDGWLWEVTHWTPMPPMPDSQSVAGKKCEARIMPCTDEDRATCDDERCTDGCQHERHAIGKKS